AMARSSDWSLALCCEPPHNHGERSDERILAAFRANTQRSSRPDTPMNVPRTESGRPSLAVTAFGITDTGRVRPSNEDQFLIAELTKTMRIWHTSLAETKARVGEEHARLVL